MIHIPHFMQLVVLCGAGLFASTVGFAALWVRARERATRAESLLEGMRMMGAREGGSIALDAIAEEVERIGEGQRFITRIMSEHASRGEMARPRTPGTITPH
jgi:hypothetical protein